ncbi:MAG: Fe-S-containing protein [Clostridia bacterium]|nr:Fe-S-containing protein [Clostridia bacterium]
MGKKGTYRKIAFAGAVVISLVVIIYFSFNTKPEKTANSDVSSSVQMTENPQDKEGEAGVTADSNQLEQTQDTNNNEKNKPPQAEVKEETKARKPEPTVEPIQEKEPVNGQTEGTQVSKKPETQKTTESSKTAEPDPVKAAPTPKPASKTDNTAIKIAKSKVTSNATFYPYQLEGVTMEVIAVKATDGTIRTALNTCQVCYDSGRGYYEQAGEYFVCQNCKNRFHVDQIEKVKGGCNPVPILEENKQDNGDYISISKDFMASQKDLFNNWKSE